MCMYVCMYVCAYERHAVHACPADYIKRSMQKLLRQFMRFGKERYVNYVVHSIGNASAKAAEKSKKPPPHRDKEEVGVKVV